MLAVKSVNVVFQFSTAPTPLKARHTVTCTPQEAFNIMMMPCFSGLVVTMVPNYEVTATDELSEMPKE